MRTGVEYWPFVGAEAPVNYRALTVSREFGSGGGRIAGMVAERLGWKLLDREIIEAIACSAHVDQSIVARFDERVESWMSRINRHAMRGAALSAGVVPSEENCFDPDVMADLTRRIITHASEEGKCVIVGRGAQCILQDRTDVFHVFVYAPLEERIQRLRSRLGPGINVEERIRIVDEERAHYMKQRFNAKWNNYHLYDLMISSHENERATADVILSAMTVA